MSAAMRVSAIVHASDLPRNTLEKRTRLPLLPSIKGHLHPSQVDPHCHQIRARKRRQFSNRTRMGCITYRRHKKKCDKAKPTGKICLQGKFECAGYRKPIQQSDDNDVQARPARKLHRRISLTEVPAHIVRRLICDIIHDPLCEPNQKIYAEHAVPSRITTSQNKPVRADRPGLQMS